MSWSPRLGSVVTPEELEVYLARERGEDAGRLAEGLVAAGVPARFRGVAPDVARAAALGPGRGLYVYGPVGTGKTTLACAVLAGWLASGGPRAAYVSSVALVEALMPSAPGRDEARARWSRVPFLVIDDLGKEAVTPWALATLFGVVDARWAGGTAHTVVTSQLGPSQLAERLAQRGDDDTARAVVSRLAGSSDVLLTSGDDIRVRRVS